MKNTGQQITSQGHELFIVGKVRKHRFVGADLRRCDSCQREWSSVAHK